MKARICPNVVLFNEMFLLLLDSIDVTDYHLSRHLLLLNGHGPSNHFDVNVNSTLNVFCVIVCLLMKTSFNEILQQLMMSHFLI